MERESGNFVRTLRKQIETNKQIKTYERNLLNDSLDHVISLILRENCFDLVSLKNFKTSELSSLADFSVSSKDPISEIQKFLSLQNLCLEIKRLEKNLVVCYFNLTGIIPGYRDKQNLVVLQFLMKSKEITEMKIFSKQDSPIFSVFESNYFFIKIWIFNDGFFRYKKIHIKSEDRDKSEFFYFFDENFDIKISFHENGEIFSINTLIKKGEKQ